MASPVRLVNLGPAGWLRTQSAYHAVAEAMDQAAPDTILLTRPLEAYLCLGFHQELEAVLDRAACAAMGLPIVRRRVGGGATLLDHRQLFYQCVFHHRRVPATVERAYALLLAGPVAALRALGVPAELRGQNEIEVGGRRIAGIGGGRIGEAAVVVGNLLFGFDYGAMIRAWRAPSASFRRLAAEALVERVTTLEAELPRPVEMDEAEARLVEQFERALGRGLEPGGLTEAEAGRIAEVESRLVSEQWLGLHANGGRPMTALKIARDVFIHAAAAEWDGLRIRAAFRTAEGAIEQARLESEPERDWRDAEERLKGVRREEWAAVVRG